MRKKKKEERIFDGPDYVVEVHDPKNDVIDSDVEEFFEDVMSKDVKVEVDTDDESDLDFYLNLVKQQENEDKEFWECLDKLFEDNVYSDNNIDN